MKLIPLLLVFLVTTRCGVMGPPRPYVQVYPEPPKQEPAPVPVEAKEKEGAR